MELTPPDTVTKFECAKEGMKMPAVQHTTLRIILKRDKTDNEHYSFTASE